MQRDEWILVFGGLAAFANAFAIGANLLANCWGPVVGAKVVKYRTAAVLGTVGQTIGVLAFGPPSYPLYGGFLSHQTKVKAYPELALYAISWTVITATVWQCLAIWQRILLPTYIATVASTLGVALLFPGSAYIDFGHYSNHPPFLTGLGPIFLTWLIAPILSITLVTAAFIFTRNSVLRGEDPFHKTLWVLPMTACHVAVILTLHLFFTIGSPQGTTAFAIAPQEIAVIAAAAGSIACLACCLLLPRMKRRLTSRRPAGVNAKRKNMLGLDEATLQGLAQRDNAADMRGRLRRLHDCLFNRDIFASIAQDPTVMQIHATAEEFDPAAEDCFGHFQVAVCMSLSVAFGANNAHASAGVFSMLSALHSSGEVQPTVPVLFRWRLMSAFGMAAGALLLGFRLLPVTGVQLAKMTPSRSYTVMVQVALAVTIMAMLGIHGAVVSYAVVFTVAFLGFAEGSSHVNWRKLGAILLWWIFGFLCVVTASYALLAQGIYAPAIVKSAHT